MRASALILIGCFCFQAAYSQLGLRIYNYRPTGEFGYVMKPTLSLEVGYMKSFENEGRIRPNFSITALIMKPRMDVFPVYGVLNETTVLPCKQSFQKYNIFQLNAGLDFAIIQRSKFDFYGGCQIILGGANVEYTDEIQTIRTMDYEGGGILGGLRLSTGVEYDLNEGISFFVNACRNVFLVTEPTSLNWANDYGVGICYTFN